MRVPARKNRISGDKIRRTAALFQRPVKLAYQYTEMAEKIYLSKDYYGLEVFALALLSKAKASLEARPLNDVRYQELSKRIDFLIGTTKPNVPVAWIKDTRNRGAFFSYIKKY